MISYFLTPSHRLSTFLSLNTWIFKPHGHVYLSTSPKMVQASLNGAYVLVCCNSKPLPVAHNDVAPKKMQGWWFNIIYYALLRVFPPFAVLLLTPLNQQNTCLLPVITPFFLSPTIVTSPTPYLYKRNTYVAQTPSSFLVRSKPKIIWKGWNLDQDLKD